MQQTLGHCLIKIALQRTKIHAFIHKKVSACPQALPWLCSWTPVGTSRPPYSTPLRTWNPENGPGDLRQISWCRQQEAIILKETEWKTRRKSYYTCRQTTAVNNSSRYGLSRSVLHIKRVHQATGRCRAAKSATVTQERSDELGVGSGLAWKQWKDEQVNRDKSPVRCLLIYRTFFAIIAVRSGQKSHDHGHSGHTRVAPTLVVTYLWCSCSAYCACINEVNLRWVGLAPRWTVHSGQLCQAILRTFKKIFLQNCTLGGLGIFRLQIATNWTKCSANRIVKISLSPAINDLMSISQLHNNSFLERHNFI